MLEFNEDTLRSFARARVRYSSVAVGAAPSGCCRVYLDFGKIRAGSKLMKMIEDCIGARFMSRPHYSYKCLYLGYDNASGRIISDAKRWESVLKAEGIDVFADCDGD